MRTGLGAKTLFLLFAILLTLGRETAAQTTNTGPGYLLHLPAVYKPLPPLDTLPAILTTIQLPPGSHPHGIALDPAGQRAFVGNHEANTLSVLDTAAMTLIQTIPLSGADGPNGVAYHPPTDRVYIANRNTANVSLVNPTAGSWLQNIAVGQMPDGLTIQDNLLYVANFGSDTVSLIDTAANTLSNTLAVSHQPAMLANGDPGTVYLTAHGDDIINFLNPNGVFNNHPNVPDPYGLTFDPITFRLYAVNRGVNNSLTLVDVSPNAAAGMIDTGPEEAFVAAVNPRTGHIFVVCGDRVKVYDRRDNALITTLIVGGGSEEGIAVDPSRNLVYVTNSDADTVTVIQDKLTFDILYTAWYSTGQLINVDDTGRHERSLTDPDLHYLQPDYRPDGRYIAVSIYSYLTGEYDIYSMESGGQNKVNLTSVLGGTEDVQPVWSPDGSQLAWRRDWRIWLMDANGDNKTPLTPPELSARDPKWSPDGRWLSFVAWEGDHEEVFIIPAAGGLAVNVTNHEEVDLGQSWSPDSQMLAFESFRDENWEIYTADISDPDNIQLTRRTNDPSNDHAPAWSNDGSMIAFLSDRNGPEFSFAAWLMNPDGSSQRPLSLAIPVLRPMDWSPDDLWLVARAGFGLEGQIYKISILNGGAYQLSNTSFTVSDPVWRPDTWGK
jgi:YVTN family beta-propeller protein